MFQEQKTLYRISTVVLPTILHEPFQLFHRGFSNPINPQPHILGSLFCIRAPKMDHTSTQTKMKTHFSSEHLIH